MLRSKVSKSHVPLLIIGLVAAVSIGVIGLQASAARTAADSLSVTTVSSSTLDKACTPATYQEPSQLDMALAPEGLSVVVDTPTSYAVYGNTVDQINGQLANCAPSYTDDEKYGAITGSSIRWQYTYVTHSDGRCTIAAPKVAVHINQLYPAWQASDQAEAGTAAAWQRFMANLTAHEQGHADLGKQYAAQVLKDMQHFPPTDCATFRNLLNAVIQQDIAMLAQANDEYDSQTDHGRTQGAVLEQITE